MYVTFFFKISKIFGIRCLAQLFKTCNLIWLCKTFNADLLSVVDTNYEYYNKLNILFSGQYQNIKT